LLLLLPNEPGSAPLQGLNHWTDENDVLSAF
jgi:hypothetical protein